MEQQIQSDQQIVDEIGSLFPSETARRVPGFDIDEFRERHNRFLEITEELRGYRSRSRIIASVAGEAATKAWRRALAARNSLISDGSLCGVAIDV